MSPMERCIDYAVFDYEIIQGYFADGGCVVMIIESPNHAWH